ncbi:prepilin-type N-terminal cleavage/methylation domain-containing protein [Chloroflexota bacterium]
MRQKGFTLVEILLALGLTSVVLTGAVLSIYQFMLTTTRSNSQVLVLDELNRAALQIKRDLQSQDTANITGNDLTLEWDNNTYFESENQTTHHSISYSLSDTGLLVRDGDNTTSVVARQIESINYTDYGTYIEVVITATSHTFPYKSETLSFNTYKRRQEVEE